MKDSKLKIIQIIIIFKKKYINLDYILVVVKLVYYRFSNLKKSFYLLFI